MIKREQYKVVHFNKDNLNLLGTLQIILYDTCLSKTKPQNHRSLDDDFADDDALVMNQQIYLTFEDLRAKG